MQPFDHSGTISCRDNTDWPSLAEPHPGRRHVQTFFWTVLTVASTVSISGNATHAVLHEPSRPILAAAVAVIPPVVLLSAVHGAAVLARTDTPARRVHWLATGMTVLMAAAAFRLSFTALRSLALLAGVPPREAWLWPLIIEGSMTQATVALLALAHTRAHASARSDGCARDAGTNVRDATTIAEISEHSTASDAPSPEFSDPDERWALLAQRLCARDPGRRRDPAEVARILHLHRTNGRNPTEIARETQRSRSTVSRIISMAARIEASDEMPELRAA